MRPVRVVLVALALLLAGFAALNPAAAVVFHIERLSDRQAVITATGVLEDFDPLIDRPAHTNIISLDGVLDSLAFDAPPENSIFQSSTMQIGTRPIDFAHDCRTFINCDPLIYFGSSDGFTVGSAVSGALTVELTAHATFAPIGSTGVAYWGIFVSPVRTGTWVMEAPSNPVPIPPALPLFATGLVVLGWVAKGSRKFRAVGRISEA